MQFIGRKKELAVLAENYAMQNGFVVLYGRRRVGKTTLINEFIQDKDALYFFATEEAERQNIQSFTAALADFTGQSYLKSAAFSDWETLFTLFAETRPESKKILVIDEFQNLTQANPAFASVFQKIWDTVLSKYPIMVILCGSYIRMMTQETLSYTSPLYGRRTAQIRLQPLRFSELAEHFTGKSFDELVKLYAVTGGVPMYLEFFEKEDDIFAGIERHILSTSGYLYEEPVFLLDREVKEPVNYFSILRAVAAGNRKLADLAGILEKKSNALGPYLKVLEELGILERRVPVTEKYPEKSRRGLYFISDSFLQFWFLFVYPNRHELERGKTEKVMEKISAEFVPRYLSFVYEEICRELFWDLCDLGDIAFSPVKVGLFWDKSVEIDVAAVDADGNLFFGECKYHSGKKPVDMRVLDALEEKARKAGFTDDSVLFGLFSDSGFAEDVNLTKAVLVNQTEVV